MAWRYFFLFLVYLGLVVTVGLASRRKMKTIEDFFLASRALPASLIAFSLTASWIGATSVLITTDEAYRHGVSALWLVGIPAVLTVLIMALALTGPIRRYGSFPLSDLLESRYGSAVRQMANVLIIWYMILLAASQMVAIGKFLHLFTGQPYFWSLAIGLLAVLLYTSLGGLFSVVITDVLQCTLLFSGLATLFIFLLPDGVKGHVVSLPGPASPETFDLFFNFSRNGLAALSFTLAWTVSPIAWQRVQAARHAEEAKKGLLMAAAAFILIYPMIVAIGILSREPLGFRFLSNPVVAELIPKTSSFLGGLLFVAIVAAILSTLDTAINASALFLTREVRGWWKKELPWGGDLPLSRLATLTAGGLAFLVATRFESILKTIGLASEIMAEGLFIPAVAMLFLRKRIFLAGFLSLTAGATFSFLSFLAGARLIPWPLPLWPGSLPFGLGLSALGWFLGWLIESRRQARIR